ncbi:MAG: amino acid racemase [Bacteroidales bacterium]|nr:amino acid racemase [Bacteroidales bacterium]
MKKFKSIGILGGMGPEATLHLFNLIIKNTPASKDQDHIPVIIYNNPLIPDRTMHIVYNEESPLELLIEGAQRLERAGADMILIACNTAHYYIKDIEPFISIPVMDMIALTSLYISARRDINVSGSIKAGILATTGTINTSLYQSSLIEHNIEPLIPTPLEQQELVMEAVYGKKGIKAGYKRVPKQLIIKAARLLIERGADVIIAGCTEIPIVLRGSDIEAELVNSMGVLAKEAVKKAKII